VSDVKWAVRLAIFLLVCGCLLGISGGVGLAASFYDTPPRHSLAIESAVAVGIGMLLAALRNLVLHKVRLRHQDQVADT
jgi:hypothetical protein